MSVTLYEMRPRAAVGPQLARRAHTRSAVLHADGQAVSVPLEDPLKRPADPAAHVEHDRLGHDRRVFE